MKLVYIVITGVPTDDEDGNLYDDFLVAMPDHDEPTDPPVLTERDDYPADKPHVRVRLKNFTLGEILICDEYGREVAGRGRKPSKWYVETEKFDSIEAAIAKAQSVLEADLRRLHAKWEAER